jgi:hypothetical protein
MLKNFIASIIAPTIAQELDKLYTRIGDIERGINSSLADIKDDMDDIRSNVDEIDPYNLGSNIADYISLDESRIASEIQSYMEADNSDNWNDLWGSLAKVEEKLNGIVKVLQPQSNEN